MTNIDFSILKRNISMHMAQTGMSQRELAELLGMSQSNVSKCLKLDDDSRRFTLEQVCIIAQHFNVSLDELVGIRPQDRDLTGKEICSFLVALCEKHIIRPFKHTTEEQIYLSEYDRPVRQRGPEVKEIEYNSFYFPKYYLPNSSDPYVADEQWAEIQACGNDLPFNAAINEFLQKYVATLAKLDDGDYTKEDYDILVDAYFRILKK